MASRFQHGCPITSVFNFGVTCVFFSWVACVFLFWITGVFLLLSQQQSRAKALLSSFWPASGLSVWVYSFRGFGLGVLLCSFIRVRSGFAPFPPRPGFAPLGFRAPFAPLRDRALLFLMFRSGYTLFSLLLCSFITSTLATTGNYTSPTPC